MGIKRTDTRPDVFTDIEGDRWAWFELHDDRGIYGHMALRNRKPDAQCHLEILEERWSHQLLKYMKRYFLPQLITLCRVNRVRRLALTKPGNDAVWGKFIRHFGASAPETKQYQVSYLEI